VKNFVGLKRFKFII